MMDDYLEMAIVLFAYLSVGIVLFGTLILFLSCLIRRRKPTNPFCWYDPLFAIVMPVLWRYLVLIVNPHVGMSGFGMIVYVESEDDSPYYILDKTIENDGWKKLNSLIFNNNIYFTYISTSLPPDNINYPSVIWINPETGQFFYRFNNSSEWNEIFYTISNIDGGDFSNI